MIGKVAEEGSHNVIVLCVLKSKVVIHMVIHLPACR